MAGRGGPPVIGARRAAAEEATRGRVAELLREGVSRRETARELGVAQSTVNRHVAALRRDGGTLPPARVAPAPPGSPAARVLPLGGTEAARALLAIRERHGLSQRRLGELLGVSVQTVRNIEAGRHVPVAGPLVVRAARDLARELATPSEDR